MTMVQPWESFPPETLQAFFDAVEINDVVDPDVNLPGTVILDIHQDEIRRCFSLCLQFWADGVARTDILRLVNIISRDGDLGPAERVKYKSIRAKYKQLRFALILYSRHHNAPLSLRVTVAIMGHLQDAFRNGHKRSVFGYTMLLRCFLAKPGWAFVWRKVHATRLDTAEGFLAYRRAEIRRLRKMLEQESFTGHQFHTMRKIVSRHVSFYDSLRSLDPDGHAYKVSRFLSAINGLMGSRHDEMVEQAISGKRAYNSPDPLNPDIRSRLEMLVERYPLEQD